MTGVLMVLLTVLKAVGIILAVILGLLIFLILLILFAPIRYEIKGYKAGDDIDALAKVRWLTPLLRADVIYKKKKGEDTVFDYWVKVFWKKIYPEDEPSDHSKWDLPEEKDELSELLEDDLTGREEKKTGQLSKDASHRNYHEETDRITEEEPEEKVPLREKLALKIKAIKEKLAVAREKVISLKDDAGARYEWVKERADFISKRENTQALGHILRELKKLLIHCLPKKGGAVIDLGFSDASATGKAVAAYSFLYPYIGRRIILNADFENSIMDARGDMKGRVILFFVLMRVVDLALDKNVRRFVKEVQRYV